MEGGSSVVVDRYLYITPERENSNEKEKEEKKGKEENPDLMKNHPHPRTSPFASYSHTDPRCAPHPQTHPR